MPEPRHRVRFDVEPSEIDGASFVVMPVVDGARLAELAGRFEEDRGYDPADGYGGSPTGAFTAETTADYFLGRAGTSADRCGPGPLRRVYLAARGGRPVQRRLALLACGDCGGQGCWPLEATVTSDAEAVTWSSFGNPHRRARGYPGFGPFRFDRAQYDDALADLVRRLASIDHGPAGAHDPSA